MNILIAGSQDQGYALIEAIGGDRSKWQVISYCGPLLAFKPDVLVVLKPSHSPFIVEGELLKRWFREDVPLIAARSKKVVQIG